MQHASGRPPSLNCQPVLTADGRVKIGYHLQVPGDTRWQVTSAKLIGPDGELALTATGAAAFHPGFPGATPIVYGELTAPLPSRGGEYMLRVKALAPLEGGAGTEGALVGPLEYNFTLPPDAVSDWHEATPVNWVRSLQGGAELRVERILRAPDRTVLWHRLNPGRLVPMRPLHAMPLIECNGALYPGSDYTPQHRGAPPAPLRPDRQPGTPGGPPLHCQVEAHRFQPLPPAPAAVRYNGLHYQAGEPWRFTLQVPPERPAIISTPVDWLLGEVPVRLQEVMLGRQATVFFVSSDPIESEGLRTRVLFGSSLTVSDEAGRIYRSGGGGGSPAQYQFSCEAIAAGVTALTLKGEAVQYHTEGPLSVPLPDE